MFLYWLSPVISCHHTIFSQQTSLPPGMLSVPPAHAPPTMESMEAKRTRLQVGALEIGYTAVISTQIHPGRL